jgi:hypothetical protein
MYMDYEICPACDYQMAMYGVCGNCEDNRKRKEVEMATPTEHRMIRYFEYHHLPDHLQLVSQHFFYMAVKMDDHLPDGPEKTTCLRKLLEAKDCAVRAALDIE